MERGRVCKWKAEANEKVESELPKKRIKTTKSPLKIELTESEDETSEPKVKEKTLGLTERMNRLKRKGSEMKEASEVKETLENLQDRVVELESKVEDFKSLKERLEELERVLGEYINKELKE